MQRFGACVSRRKILSTHGRFLLGFQCRVKADSPQSMHHQEIVEKAGRMRHYNIAGSRLATLLRFCRRPGAVSGRSLAEVEEGSAEELRYADMKLQPLSDTTSLGKPTLEKIPRRAFATA
ncbi:hypothetical protein NDU88_006955 [Pleurodeles waltl]|uniref:Uncharacterized protein n=1 Tax=Pleurodeles waltl TaxID=8319 RepID=A0AAV7VRC5_PLEWA|nr:hypothetical protein NDU88_006955 [Pleurodeles waltl]